MTQVGKGLIKASPKPMLKAMVDVDTVSRDKSPSPELFEMIQAAASSLTGFAQLWDSIRKKGNSEGFTDTELEDLIKPLLKQQLNMSREQIWYMFNKEKKAITNKEAYDSRRINTQNNNNKDPEKKYENIIHEKDEKLKEKDKVIEEKDATISQLEDAFHKVTNQQFIQATKIQSEPPKEVPKFDVDEAFKQLPDDNSMTSWKIARISGNALKNKISAWQGNTNKIFRVWLQEVNA